MHSGREITITASTSYAFKHARHFPFTVTLILLCDHTFNSEMCSSASVASCPPEGLEPVSAVRPGRSRLPAVYNTPPRQHCSQEENSAESQTLQPDLARDGVCQRKGDRK